MHILIAPDKFKGVLTAADVAKNIAAGIREVLPEAQIDIVPMGDGGEGTAQVISEALRGVWLKSKVHDPLGREIEARYAWIDHEKRAVMEMSEAAGMRRLSTDELDPLQTNTFGVGEMILDATWRGAHEIIIGLGGSATTDGGFGMARALGFGFFADAKQIYGSIDELEKLTRIVAPSPAASRLPLPEGEDGGEGRAKIIAAVDVRNPLLGDNGATRVFGPQKGATPEKIEILEQALTRLADVVARDFGFDYRNEPGAGAAGGLGFGLMSFCRAKIRAGFDVVAEAVELEAKIQKMDVVITGEGSLDRQTLGGKTPAGVARLARKCGKRVFAFVGCAVKDRELHDLFDGVFENARAGMSQAENMRRAAELLRENAYRLAMSL
jgi:glycerate 2-kinase